MDHSMDGIAGARVQPPFVAQTMADEGHASPNPSEDSWEIEPPSDNEEVRSDVWALATSDGGDGALAAAVAEAAANRKAAEEAATAGDDGDGDDVDDDEEEDEEEDEWEAEESLGPEAEDESEPKAEPELEEGTLASWSYSTVVGEEAVAAGAQIDEEWEMDSASVAPSFVSDAVHDDAASEVGSLASFAFSESSRPDYPPGAPLANQRRPRVPPQASALPDSLPRRLTRKEAAAKQAARPANTQTRALPSFASSRSRSTSCPVAAG